MRTASVFWFLVSDFWFPSERDVSMFFRRILIPLVAQHRERGDQFAARESRLDDLVDVSTLGGDVWIREFFFVLRDARRAIFGAAIKNVDGAFRPHHRDLRGRIRVIHVGANVL